MYCDSPWLKAEVIGGPPAEALGEEVGRGTSGAGGTGALCALRKARARSRRMPARSALPSLAAAPSNCAGSCEFFTAVNRSASRSIAVIGGASTGTKLYWSTTLQFEHGNCLPPDASSTRARTRL